MQPETLRALATEGFAKLPATSESLAWAGAARTAGAAVLADPDQRAQWLRHGGTWFVGVDALPTDGQGGCLGVPLPWADWLLATSGQAALHPAQLSVTFPGYPGREPGEGDKAHAYRMKRAAAHVDGLHKGAGGCRYLIEAHAVILGVGLNEAAPDSAPLTIWPGSHRPMGEALSQALPRCPKDWAKRDVAGPYSTARREVFDQIAPVPVPLAPGEAILLHRHLLHGIAPWSVQGDAQEARRMTAYFRPDFSQPDRWPLQDAVRGAQSQGLPPA